MRIFYASDVHASNRCFKKFLNAGKFYGSDAIVLGGDITGKAIVPFVEQGGGEVHVTFLGKQQVLATEEEVRAVEQRVGDTGYYPHRCSADEAEELSSDSPRLHALFTQKIVERVEEWMALANERLSADGAVPCFVNAGNDDPKEIDEVIDSAARVEFLEGRVVELPNGMELASCGYANMTPWQCPRDVQEDELGGRLEAVSARVRDPEWAIFNFHCPPYDTQIDQGPMLGADMRMRSTAGGVEMHAVGSTACRAVIERYQPLLGFHGHLHESRGTFKLGKTVCINPGSEYSEGVLRGAIVDIN
ncbi:MAG: metallophosphoesterase, partial [Actinomycetota bacterium]|nr:metallophosphoesterase [Actinomycetota bacterium]